MKKIHTMKFLLGALIFGAGITACDKFEDDVPPARMENLIVNDDNFTTLKNQGLRLNVLANDTIGSTATLQFSQPQQGTIQADSAGNVYYQPAPNFIGTDAFTYKACLDNNCATANVTVTVQNDTSNVCTVKAFDDIRNLDQNRGDSLRVMLNDNLCGEIAANTTLSIIQPPVHGNAFTTTFKQVVYSPDINYVGPDEVTYRITNSKGTSTAKVLLNVKSAPQNCRVVAKPDMINLPHNQSFDSTSVHVLANDTWCSNGTTGTVTIASQPTYGSAHVIYTGTNSRIIYMTSTPSRNVTDTFQYEICQGNNCSTSTVTVNIQ